MGADGEIEGISLIEDGCVRSHGGEVGIWYSYEATRMARMCEDRPRKNKGGEKEIEQKHSSSPPAANRLSPC